MAASQSISTTDYAAAYNALSSYLTGLSPAYDDTSADTAVDPVIFASRLNGYLGARQTLLNAVSAKNAKTADWSSVSGGENKPKDYADKTGDNTSKDTANVGGTPAATVRDNAAKGSTALANVTDLIDNRIPAIKKTITDANTAIKTVSDNVEAKLGTSGTVTTTLTNLTTDGATYKTQIKQLSDDNVIINRKIEEINAGDGANDSVARAAITKVETAYKDADKAFTESLATYYSTFTDANTNTNTKIDNAVRTLTDANAAIGTRTSELEVSVAGPSNSLNKNPDFSSWPNGQSLPSGWDWWENVAAIYRVSKGAQGGYAAVIDCGAYPTGITVSGVAMAAGWVVMEADVYLESGDWSGTGMTLSGVYNLAFSTYPDTNGVASNDPNNRRRRFSYLVQVTTNAWNVHAMNNYSPLGGYTPKRLHWYRCAVRAATDGEIKALKVDAQLNNPGGLVAKVSNQETAIADFPKNYASASKVTEVVVRLDNDTTGLGALSGRVSTAQQVALDAKNRTAAAYFQLNAEAGNNRAQLSVYATDRGGGVDIVGDTTFKGSLEVGTTKSGARTEITSQGIRVIGSNNMPRVILGDF